MLSDKDKQQLSRAGFCDVEIDRWDESTTVHRLDSPLWQDVISGREKMILVSGLSKRKFKGLMLGYYNRFHKSDPFEWLKAEYRSPKKQKWQAKSRRKVRKRINYRLNKIYEEAEKRQKRELLQKRAIASSKRKMGDV